MKFEGAAKASRLKKTGREELKGRRPCSLSNKRQSLSSELPSEHLPAQGRERRGGVPVDGTDCFNERREGVFEREVFLRDEEKREKSELSSRARKKEKATPFSLFFSFYIKISLTLVRHVDLADSDPRREHSDLKSVFFRF